MEELSYILNHLGEERDEYLNAIAPPIFQTSNFAFSSVNEMKEAIANEKKGLIYSRGNNPTSSILCKKLAALEGTDEALAFASGMAAISSAIISFVKAGDHIVSVSNPYSWTYILLTRFLSRFNVHTTFIEGKDPEEFLRAIQPETKLFYLESPNTFTFGLQDLTEVSAIARNNGIVTLIDNSYSSPLTQNPVKMGIDIVLHSASKYLGGHSDIVAGVVCGSKNHIRQIFENEFMGLGGIISPFNAWLMLRGLRTLDIRIEKISVTATRVISFLESHPKIEEVLYPMKPSGSQYALACKQMTRQMGLFTIRLKSADLEQAELFVNSLKRFIIGVSWGGHESLVFPAMSFESGRANTEFKGNLVRIYTGLDEADVLIDDLNQALANIR
jgi:cystathionine beta-lyase/cystathionine gamma-synthase